MQAVISWIGTPLALASALQVLGRRRIEIDDAVGIARADGDLVHVHVGRVQQAAALGDREHGQRVRHLLGADRGAFERIDGDVDFRAFAGADLLADVEHRRFVHLAFADHDRAADRRRGRVRGAWRRRRPCRRPSRCRGRASARRRWPPPRSRAPLRARARAQAQAAGCPCPCIIPRAAAAGQCFAADRLPSRRLSPSPRYNACRQDCTLLEFFDADHLRTLGDLAVRSMVSSALRIASSVVSCVMMMTEHGRLSSAARASHPARAARRAMLHDAFQRDAAVAHARGDGRHHARLVVEREAHVVGAVVRVELGALVRLELRASAARTAAR